MWERPFCGGWLRAAEGVLGVVVVVVEGALARRLGVGRALGVCGGLWSAWTARRQAGRGAAETDFRWTAETIWQSAGQASGAGRRSSGELPGYGEAGGAKRGRWSERGPLVLVRRGSGRANRGGHDAGGQQRWDGEAGAERQRDGEGAGE